MSRYSRQIAVPGIGREGQVKISTSKVLIIGAGALGSMVAMQLAGAGVGKLGIADYDTVDVSNLQRQFFFTTAEAGKKKSKLVALRVKELNPEVEIEVYDTLITSKKAEEIFYKYDFIVDATDNPESKRMTGNTSKTTGKACCIGGVRDFSGQVMTFMPSDARLEEYFGEAEGEGVLPCSLSGVMGPAAAMCASLQASETLKYIVGTGTLLSGELLLFNLADNLFRKIKL